MSDVLDLQSASEFLWREADILDRQDYDAWLDLWLDDGLYIIPTERNADNYADILNFAYDNAEMREMRVKRLKSRFSMSAVSASTTVRTTSRFVILESSPQEIVVRAAQLLADYRRDRMQIVAADVEATICMTEKGLKLKRKIVWLANCEDAVSGFAYLL